MQVRAIRIMQVWIKSIMQCRVISIMVVLARVTIKQVRVISSMQVRDFIFIHARRSASQR